MNFKEKKLSKIIFGALIIGAFTLIFGPNIYAQFTRVGGGVSGYGYDYGYGYGYGYGIINGTYRINGNNLSTYDYGYGYGTSATISPAAITGVTAPVAGATPVTTVTATTAYTATVTWSGNPTTFDVSSVYVATITLTPNAGYTAAGVTANFFTVSGATTVTNPINSGVVTATFPVTSGGGNGGGGNGGGGGGTTTTYCTSVTYTDWQTSCTNGLQTRSVFSRTPSSCTLTSDQNAITQRSCTVNANGDVTVISNPGEGSAFVALEKSLVTKVNLSLAKRLAGRILLQVESHGEAWYVNPLDVLKYFLGRPADAFAIMRKFGLGVSEKDYNTFTKGTAPASLSGRILLRVQAHGEAYYVNPLDHKLYSMGRPADAFALMRRFGLGISNADLRQIGVGEIK